MADDENGRIVIGHRTGQVSLERVCDQPDDLLRFRKGFVIQQQIVQSLIGERPPSPGRRFHQPVAVTHQSESVR